MPLSKPNERKQIHNRKINLQAFERNDGLWDIEGHLIDTKSYSFPNDYREGYIAAGEHIHEMWLRLTVDRDKEVIDAEAVIDFGPFPICPNITSSYKNLIGEIIGPGWTQRMRKLFGGTNGCTHLLELLGPIATTAYQAMHASVSQSKQNAKIKPAFINGCHAWADSGSIVKELFPQHYIANNDKNV